MSRPNVKKLHKMRKFNNGLNRPFSSKVSTYLEAKKKCIFNDFQS